jgi:hypothetical protein
MPIDPRSRASETEETEAGVKGAAVELQAGRVGRAHGLEGSF